MSERQVVDIGTVARGMIPDREIGEVARGQFLWQDLNNFRVYQGALSPLAQASGFGDQALDSVIKEICVFMLGDDTKIVALTDKEAYEYDPGGLSTGSPWKTAKTDRITRRWTLGKIASIANTGPGGVGRVTFTAGALLANPHGGPKANDEIQLPDGNWYVIRTINSDTELDITVPYGIYGGPDANYIIRCFHQIKAREVFDWTVFEGKLIITSPSDPPMYWDGTNQFQLLGGYTAGAGILANEHTASFNKFRAKCVTCTKGFVAFGNIEMGSTSYPRVWLNSNLDDPTTYLQSGLSAVGAGYDILNDSETPITAMECVPPFGFATFTRDKIYTMQLSTAPSYSQVFTTIPINNTVGTFGPRSVARFAKQPIAFVGTDYRLYLFDGSRVDNGFSAIVQGYVERKINRRLPDLFRVAFLPYRNEIAFALPAGFTKDNRVQETLLFNYESQTWSRVQTPGLTALASGVVTSAVTIGDLAGLTIGDLPLIGDFIKETWQYPLWGNEDGETKYFDYNGGDAGTMVSRTPLAESAAFSLDGAANLHSIVGLEWESKDADKFHYFLGVAAKKEGPYIWFGRTGENSATGFLFGDDFCVSGNWFKLRLGSRYTTPIAAPRVEAMRLKYTRRGMR